MKKISTTRGTEDRELLDTADIFGEGMFRQRPSEQSKSGLEYPE